MRFALAQINTTVGDIDGNVARIINAIERAGTAQADIVLIPELAVLGYPPRDLLYKEGIVERCERAVADHIAPRCTGGLSAVIGSPRRRPHRPSNGKGVCNSAAVCRDGRISLWYDKRLLPTYDVFDENRYFDPGHEPAWFEHHGQLIGLTICEDLWNDDAMLQRHLYDEDVVGDLLKTGAVDAIVNISASPFSLGKPQFRRQLFGRVATRAKAPVIFTNLVGGNDDLIFDGSSAALAADGGVLTVCRSFAEDFAIADIPAGPNRLALDPPEIGAQLFHALTLGLRDYVSKCGFSSTIIALSGGIDSAVVAALACAALGPDRVHGVGMPSRFSSAGSINDARELAQRLGIRFDLISIEPAHEAILNMLEPMFKAAGTPPGTAEENIQSRLRGNIVMSLSNKTGDLLLTTGNKSELAVGYCTLYGDMAGGLAVISDVPKTMVYELARWMNRHPEVIGVAQPPIPESTMTKPPSAELRPDQKDTDSLPPYDILDAIIARYVEKCQSVERIVRETGFEAGIVLKFCRMIDRNEYKRRQMPVGLKVTTRAFGSGWRMPIAARGV